jgi:hypothetical protein
MPQKLSGLAILTVAPSIQKSEYGGGMKLKMLYGLVTTGSRNVEMHRMDVKPTKQVSRDDCHLVAFQ